MARGTSTLRARKLKANKPKRAARELADRDLADLCHGQACYLAIEGVCSHCRETVVPAHSNQAQHGKGFGLKALHRYTVPGCWACHVEIDQGLRLTKQEKFAIWDRAYAAWEPVRAQLIGEKRDAGSQKHQ